MLTLCPTNQHSTEYMVNQLVDLFTLQQQKNKKQR